MEDLARYLRDSPVKFHRPAGLARRAPPALARRRGADARALTPSLRLRERQRGPLAVEVAPGRAGQAAAGE